MIKAIIESKAIPEYGIRDIINYRAIDWSESEDFFYLTNIPSKFEPYFVQPNYYCVGMITTGSLKISISGQVHSLTTNSLMIYRPGQTFKVVSIAEKTQGTFILFTKKFLEYLNENIFSVRNKSFLSNGISSMIELTQQDSSRVSALFQEIFYLLQSLSKTNWELIARNLTSALLYETDNLLGPYTRQGNVTSTEGDNLASAFNNLVMKYFKTSRSLTFYATKLGITTSTLYVEIKKKLGESPSALIAHRVISEASYLITHTSRTFSEIGYLLNFTDPFTFSKYFKKHTGLSPKQYRKQLISQ
ncbi:helix-turn-helix domain-containing protein [Dyadobacter frigoris]|uniref:Helix-turn-helix domain-containing protein n=1 Tax=Dyadobacter frigoris TaxID=2576211 RepID=A0A4V6BKG4_9BACT|nr:helix-turn-helix domain-containing protein [Dyadobacter frigoris]TKT90723.1 helix-turn-helix domain-containing protein [Dyadobacter frigoris]GLU52054.1 AraC family transcriptional regulator [Dyadobacter frigoris]